MLEITIISKWMQEQLIFILKVEHHARDVFS